MIPTFMAAPNAEAMESAYADQGHEKVAVIADTKSHEMVAGTGESILDMLNALTYRMQDLETSQMKIDAKIDCVARSAVDYSNQFWGVVLAARLCIAIRFDKRRRGIRVDEFE